MTEATQDPPDSAAHRASEAQAGQDDDDAGESKKAKPRTPIEIGRTKSPRKRRKVNHACIYCRRSERPCTRCIKRDIGHLCHDEPREQVKRARSELDHIPGEDGTSPNVEVSPVDGSTATFEPQPNQQDTGLDLGTGALALGKDASAGSILQPTSLSATQAQTLPGNNQMYTGFNNWNLSAQNQFRDIHSLHPSYLFSTSETTDEFNLLNNFLSASLLDEGGSLYPGDDVQGLLVDPTLRSFPGGPSVSSNKMPSGDAQTAQPPHTHKATGNPTSRPQSNFPIDKARETYFMTAADPTGTDTAEDRMNKLLKAKYDAGLLKPFNYVKGYAKLNQYMERNLQPASRQKIRRQLDKFRPKFRERMQSLTDIELVYVEMWFERSLMEYDRVFASMAIPACCWRRTGEIFRGNKEMAELIHVPMVQLRDGKVTIHDILAEESLVNYWDKFGAIAFDSSQKAILTRCSLKNPDISSSDPEIPCCFSFTIRRDTHNIPSIIVGNFLPIRSAD
ncbi:MAG: hypothetical protein M1820_008838 [Bogoriella megaspora]|nr:MAG: hypothetical protein M1820_008838 [Bogoriella megaspora]